MHILCISYIQDPSSSFCFVSNGIRGYAFYVSDSSFYDDFLVNQQTDSTQGIPFSNRKSLYGSMASTRTFLKKKRRQLHRRSVIF